MPQTTEPTKMEEMKPLMAMLSIETDGRAVAAALSLALSAVDKTPDHRLHMHTIRWSIAPDYLTITGANRRSLHSVRILAKQQPSRTETFEFCMLQSDAREMVSKVASGGMEIHIQQTTPEDMPNLTEAEYRVEARWFGSKQRVLFHMFTGMNRRYASYKDILSGVGDPVASISGDAGSLLEYLAPTAARILRLGKGCVSQSPTPRDEDGHHSLTVVGKIEESFDVSKPVAFLKHIPSNQAVQMDFSGQGNAVKMRCGLYGAVATCLFMPLRVD